MSEVAVKTLVHVREKAEANGGFNLKQAFAEFDLDGGGSIDHDELTKVRRTTNACRQSVVALLCFVLSAYLHTNTSTHHRTNAPTR
jgi:hypothetical protein